MAEEIIKEVKFENNPKSISDKKMQEEGIPAYMEKLELSEEQRTRLVLELKAEVKVIQEERDSKQLGAKWDALDNQYDGKVNEDELMQFNLNRNITKVKIDNIVTSCSEAFFETDPIFAVTPRPEFGKGNIEICNKQQDFLDYKVDNLPFKPEMDLVFHSAAVKGLGWLELFHDIKREPRKREEYYESKMEIAKDPSGQPIPNADNTGPQMKSKGLDEFLSNWPSALKDYPGKCKALSEGKDIEFVAVYKETIYNDPKPKFHDIKDVLVRAKTDGYEGLKTTRLIAVRENFTWWELKKEEQADKFYDIDDLVNLKDGERPENHETLDYDILKCTYCFRMNPDNDEETKIICWMAEEKKIIIGSTLYPYYAVPCCYLPFTLKRKKKGIYQPGVAEDMTDSNIAENAILNATLETAYITNTVTPITKDPEVQAQFLEKRFAHGVPIEADAGSIDFLQKYMKPADIGGMLSLMQYLVLGDDQVSRVSSLMSGAESPFDPNAPARKTMALLQQSGRGIMDYVKHLLPTFNEIGYILLLMYFQMSKQGKEYKPSPERSSDENPFATLTRNDMVTRTSIETQAYAFVEDKVNEKVLDLSLYQTIRQEPLIAKNPDAVYTLLNQLVTGWSPKWKNIASRVIPTMSEFQKMQAQAALQGVAMYAQAMQKEEQTTGVDAPIDPEKLMAVVGDLRAQTVSAIDPKIQKENEKNAQ